MLNPKRLITLSLLAVTASLLAATAAGAATLTWSQTNSYAAGCSSTGLDCTALGIVASNISGGGSQAATGGAIGETVDQSSAKGAVFDVAFTSSDASAFAGTAASNLSGVAKFPGAVVRTIHSIVHTVETPLLILRGDGTGALYVTGSHEGTPYAGQIFELDLDGRAPDPSAPAGSPGLVAGYPAASLTNNGDGTSTISGIVPSVPSDTTAIVGAYNNFYNQAGLGPNRIPNIFGSFSLRIANPVATATAQPPTTNTPLPVAPKFKKYKLKKAPFGKRAKQLVVRVSRKGKVIGFAEVTGRTVRFIGTELKLKGTYRLAEVGGKQRKTTVRFS